MAQEQVYSKEGSEGGQPQQPGVLSCQVLSQPVGGVEEEESGVRHGGGAVDGYQLPQMSGGL